MVGTREWLGSLMLRMPAPLRSVPNIPILGSLVHRLSHIVLSADKKIRARVKPGPGKSLWLELSPRTGKQYPQGKWNQRSSGLWSPPSPQY